MFDTAETGHRIDDETYGQSLPGLRTALLETQYAVLEQARFPVILVIAGVEGAGKGEILTLLNEWMDPRHIHTHAFGLPAGEDLAHPRMARYWRTLPPKGRLGIYLGSWYAGPMHDRVSGDLGKTDFERRIEGIVRFERMLADEGALLLKLWLHLSRKGQRRAFKQLESDPHTRWRVTAEDWAQHARYKRLIRAAEGMLRATSTAAAPWYLVDGTDANYRALAVGRTLLEAMRARIGASEPAPARRSAPPMRDDGKKRLAETGPRVDLDKRRYDKLLPKEQGRLNRLSRDKRFRGRGVVAVFEGLDAAGKGGAIRRVTRALDARFYQVVPVSAPTDEELAQPYLWRFWRRIPRAGRFTLFDRSWYGRVLVERVEGYCSRSDWMRAYGEINDFEEELSEAGIVLAKFWLAISPEEQLRRFKAREQVSFKRHKLTDDDWRNRRRWNAYQRAAADMIGRTSTDHAPWTVVEADDKHHARIKVLRTLSERIEAAL